MIFICEPGPGNSGEECVLNGNSSGIGEKRGECLMCFPHVETNYYQIRIQATAGARDSWDSWCDGGDGSQNTCLPGSKQLNVMSFE